MRPRHLAAALALSAAFAAPAYAAKISAGPLDLEGARYYECRIEYLGQSRTPVKVNVLGRQSFEPYGDMVDTAFLSAANRRHMGQESCLSSPESAPACEPVTCVWSFKGIDPSEFAATLCVYVSGQTQPFCLQAR